MTHRVASVVSFLIVLILVGVFIPTATAQEPLNETQGNVTYEIIHNTTTNETMVTAHITQHRDTLPDTWKLVWRVPEEAQLHTVKTDKTTQVSTRRDGSTITVQEVRPAKRNTATFTITYTTETQIEVTQQSGLRQLSGSLPAYQNASTTATVTLTNGTLINTFRYSPHSVNTTENRTKLRGEGPVSFTTNVKMQSPTQETDEFAVYGGTITPTVLNDTYSISTRGTGTDPQINQMPILILPEDEYNSQFGEFSSGWFTEGVIYLTAEITTQDRRLLPLLTHEYTHAITARVQPTIPAQWFTEGASRYVESIARNQTNVPQGRLQQELFISYQRQNKTWVEDSWYAPNGSATRFAYVYSELLFKHSVIQNQTQVPVLYDKMATGELIITQNTTPSVLFGDTWNGTVCASDEDDIMYTCATQSLSYIPPNETPETYARPFSDEPPSIHIESEVRSNTTASSHSNVEQNKSVESVSKTPTSIDNRDMPTMQSQKIQPLVDILAEVFGYSASINSGK